ncbi:NAD(P)-dependent oxidoreductase [Roseicella aquatilis]|uniref:NAD(P)-dependent oxidoreductase n=1 Tax=Roseicella aquatilis TaxID=2527868 RepID=A0A4R4DTA7_9PROT|nr:NAD(P)-dependent oxidoreductase [Roseicella aquatilis]TCZ66054.1 NAD(P)-dependent oxidoreductase [Roseicella aquatilis]
MSGGPDDRSAEGRGGLNQPRQTTTLGFVGLGAMGAPMVRRLLGAGHRVLVHDVNMAAVAAAVSKGAEGRTGPAAVASEAEVVLVSLPTPDVVRQVALGPGGLIEGGAMRVYVDLSTTGAQVAQAVADGLAARGVTALDAPVSGGVAGAEAGTLSVMAAGDPAAFERLRPVLEVIGANTVLVGDRVGLGQTLKLVNNLLAATTWAAACEALAMGARAGLDPELMVGVINRSSGRSFATEKFAAGPVLTRRFDFGFRMELMAKDMRLALQEAEALGLVMPTSRAAQMLYGLAMAGGGGKGDVTELARVTEGWAGVEIAAARRNEA